MASSSNGLRNRTNWASERVTSSESASWGARKLEKLGNVSTEPAANFYPNEDATAPSGTACPLKVSSLEQLPANVLDEHFWSSTSAWTSCISWRDVGRCKDLPCLRKRASADFGANYAAALALDLFVEREGIVTPSEARTAPDRLEQRLLLPTLESLEHLGPTKQFCTSLCPWLPSAF
eukprot:s637_g21.t2